MSRVWKVGDVAWFADEKQVYQAEIVEMVDGDAYTALSKAARYCFNPINIFETKEAADRANARWALEDALEWAQDGGADPAQAEERVQAALARLSCLAVSEERARIRKLCLDAASIATGVYKRAKKKGAVAVMNEKHGVACGLLRAAMFCVPPEPKKPKPKKARKVTT